MASSAVTGDIVLSTCVVEYLGKTSAAITKGDVLKYSATGFLKTAAASAQEGPFAVAIETKASTTTVVKAVRNKGAMVYVTAGGAINPGSYVMADSSVAGQVIAYAKSAVSNDTTGIKTARDESKYIIGHYAAHVDEGNGDTDASAQATAPTAAASTDVVRVMLGGL